MTETLEKCPNPWCNSHKTTDCEIVAAEAPILMPSRASFEWAVACPVCPVQTPWFETEAEAITAWNRRTPDTALVEALGVALAGYDATVKACPANQRFLGEKPCPKCGAGSNEGCRREIIAAGDVIRQVRATLKARAGL